MKYYHGTSYECAMGILKKGFGGYDQDAVWSCSYEGHTYTWLQDEGVDEPDDSAQFKAMGNAQITAAKYGSTHEEIVVFTLEMPDMVGNEWAIEDDSCPNMEGAYSFDNDWLNKNIANGTVKMMPEVATAYVPGFRWLYLTDLPREYLDLGEKEEVYLKIAGNIVGNIYHELEFYFSPNDFVPLEVLT